MKRNIVITGGAGFIGSHVVRLFVNKYPEYHIINLDKLTYAGNLANLKDIENKPNYEFVKMDICDFDAFYKLMQDKKVDGIIHLAAESHVDRSIKDPFTFAKTNVMGTLSLLQAAKLYWESQPTPYEVRHEVMVNGQCSMVNVPCRFYHISTDEVYGALELTHQRVSSLHSQLPHQAQSIIWLMAISSSWRLPSIILTHHTRLRKHHLTILFAHSTIPTACL